jgi:DNA-binding Xre family transcriptional regulator
LGAKGVGVAIRLSSSSVAKIGLSDSTLQRIEMAEQNVTLDTLQLIVTRLRCKGSDIFPD